MNQELPDNLAITRKPGKELSGYDVHKVSLLPGEYVILKKAGNKIHFRIEQVKPLLPENQRIVR